MYSLLPIPTVSLSSFLRGLDGIGRYVSSLRHTVLCRMGSPPRASERMKCDGVMCLAQGLEKAEQVFNQPLLVLTPSSFLQMSSISEWCSFLSLLRENRTSGERIHPKIGKLLYHLLGE